MSFSKGLKFFYVVSTRQPFKRGKACHFECFFHLLPVILKNFVKLDLFLMTKFPQRNLFRILRSDCSSIIKKEKMYREVITPGRVSTRQPFKRGKDCHFECFFLPKEKTFLSKTGFIKEMIFFKK